MSLNLQMRSLSLGSVRPAGVRASLRLGSPSTSTLNACAMRAGNQLKLSTPMNRDVVSTEVVAGKLKTRKAAAKRYKITGSGKVMVRRPGKQHLNEKYSASAKKKMSKERALSRSVVKRNVIGAMPYAKIDKSKNPKCMEREVNKRAAKVGRSIVAEEAPAAEE
mmetsp:Transcript_39689/g.112601  ORF Transcript_39689/g.112601 Transcript_39689/m.112601 type:complete len:164 (-) Transcript_39689:135-626(-)|eukprot:CAMPEP_0117670042 /NCGR_PEP_ID=MMETSP0804-20121206/12505_1 /TAXON_ID=1074897 /ORGANISM="Tetraselmis astigmatica, Strain CCMP880" /LENGTH=163 /DNA_ID=CAMNT_0005478241 /DNA_START=83 /DNA_END=574 /DNA_ORIENTATION=-